MGLFEMDGGASTEPAYEIASPIFNKITISLDPKYYPGKEFVIEAKNVSSKNRYIQSAKLNGQPLNKFWFRHSELIKGGRLELEMGSEPNKQWASNSEHPQLMDVEYIVTTPYIFETERLFLDERAVKLACDTKGAEIYYTTDGSEPDKNSTLYTAPFTVNKTTTVKMKAFVGDRSSLPALAEIKKAVMAKPVHLGEVEPGLKFSYYEGFYRMVNDFVQSIPVKRGVTPNFTTNQKQKEQYFAFQFEGFLKVPEDGLYTIYLAANDGARLSIDGSVLINNDGLHPLTEIYKQVSLKSGFHPIYVGYFQEGGTHGFKVSWQGPGFEKQEIASTDLFHTK
jgi:hypothetical protein